MRCKVEAVPLHSSQRAPKGDAARLDYVTKVSNLSTVHDRQRCRLSLLGRGRARCFMPQARRSRDGKHKTGEELFKLHTIHRLAWYVFVSRRRPSRMRSMMMLPTSSNPTMAPPLRTFRARPCHTVSCRANRNQRSTHNGEKGVSKISASRGGGYLWSSPKGPHSLCRDRVRPPQPVSPRHDVKKERPRNGNQDHQSPLSARKNARCCSSPGHQGAGRCGAPRWSC